ncbi:MAG: cell division protein ZapA [Lachnospiraceae bacterium]|nr:cell division protein ZapA [Lachnospiraceae bacterium]
MDSKIEGEVVIGGKVYTISGYENEEYYQRIANYINGKLGEFAKMETFKKLPMDYQSILMELNIADDYFKAKKQIEMMEEEMKAREKELYDLKHELISYQIKQENTEKALKKATDSANEKEKEIIRLQALASTKASSKKTS